MFSLDKRTLWEDLTAAFQYMKGAYKKDGEGLFPRACSDRTRGSGFKLKESRFRLDTGKIFFTRRVVRHWNRSPQETAGAPSLEARFIQRLTIIKQVSHYSTKRHSLEPVENDAVPQNAQCTHCSGAAGRQVQKCHNTNKPSSGDIHCSHASKIKSTQRVLHRK